MYVGQWPTGTGRKTYRRAGSLWLRGSGTPNGRDRGNVRNVAALAWLVVLLTVAALVGVNVANAFAALAPGLPWYLWAVCAYDVAAVFVGFGLVTRVLRGSIFVVPLGGVFSWAILLTVSLFVGVFALPFVVGYRLWRGFTPGR